MRLKEASPNKLSDRHERAIAKLARIARANTYFGGASALVLMRRLEAMHSAVPAGDIVSDIYGASNGSCLEWGAYECPECGQAHLGTDAAYRCCQPTEE